MLYRKTKYKGEPLLPKEAMLPPNYTTRDTVEIDIPPPEWVVEVTKREHGRPSQYFFRGKGAAQEAFDFGNKQMLEYPTVIKPIFKK